MTSKLEAPLQAEVEKILRKNRWYVIRLNMGYLSGLSDLLAMKDSRTIWIELKRPDGKGRATGQQDKFREDVLAHGCEAYKIKSVEELYDIMKKPLIN